MISFVAERFNRLVFLLSVLFLCCTLYFIWYVQNTPFMGVFLELNQGKWIVQEVESFGVGHQWGIKQGDLVFLVDGAAPEENYNVYKWGILENVDSLNLLTTEGVYYELKVKEGGAVSSSSKMLSLTALSFAFWAIATYTYIRKPRFTLIKYFWLLMTAISFAMMASIPSSHGLLPARILVILSVAWIPFLTVSFVQQFLEKFDNPSFHRIRNVFRLIGVLFTISLFVYLLVNLSSPLIVKWFRYGLLAQIGLLLLSLPVAFRSSKNKIAPSERNQFLVLLFGFLAGILPFFIFTVVPDLILKTDVIPFQYTLLSIVILPLTCAYVLTKRQIIDMKFYLGGYRSFFKKKDALRQQKIKLLLVTQGEQTYKTMRLILELIHKVIDIDGMFLIWYRKESPVFSSTGCFENKEKELQKWLEKDFPRRSDSKRLTYGNLIHRVFVIGSNQEPHGYLVVGNKRNRSQFTSKEIEFLRNLTEDLLDIYIHFSMYDELQKEYQTRANRSYGKDDIAISKDVSQLLIEAQEEEKIRIAQYLHDQILQSLIFLSRDLKRIGDNNPLLAEREKLDFLVRNVNDTIYEIREICAELYPSIIEDLGLREAIRWYVREIKEKRNVLIDWKYEMEDEHLLPFTTKVSLFRIIKELVNNALKHAEAETIQLSLVLKNDTLTCEISDDGKGIDVPIDFHAFLNGKHLGLVTVQKRIEHLGGSLSFHSAPGKGTRVSFELPVWSKEWEHEQAN